MVKICDNKYPDCFNDTYLKYFNMYPYELSCFQKYSIEAIVEGHHVLVTAHTGSGKTMPAEFAIDYFVSMKKRVIYTSPIKALSNQKFREFSEKFPNISFGILTGDIKFNPEADVIIMTTEILQNLLYKKKCTDCTDSNKINENGSSQLTNIDKNMFNINIDLDLSCVIFDEIHYINDENRGKVWEETIIMLPKHIQMIMLSATIDKPEIFARWCETRENNDENKIVYIASTNKRVVPLSHYSFISSVAGVNKKITDKGLLSLIDKYTDKPVLLQDHNGTFNNITYDNISKIKSLFYKQRIIIKRQHVINNLLDNLFKTNKLPAICFVLNKKLLEKCASEVTVNIIDIDNDDNHLVVNECNYIIRKLTNYNEYIHTPEYMLLVSLAKKGIGMHHAGMLPILREMTELLFVKKFIKVLFATETFSIGINMPTKTVIFTNISKFDGYNNRLLYPHEYTQMSGRAGRRGIDTVGHVIHLTNLFNNEDYTKQTFMKMMTNTPQLFSSKFKVSFDLIINLIMSNTINIYDYLNQSMISWDIKNILTNINKSISELTDKINNNELIVKKNKIPNDILIQYIEYLKLIDIFRNNKQKKLIKKIKNIKDNYEHIDTEIYSINLSKKYNDEMTSFIYQRDNSSNFLKNNANNIIEILKNNGYINTFTENTNIILTQKGIISSQIHEVHCLIFANALISYDFFINMDCDNQAINIVALFSCFASLKIKEEYKTNTIPDCDSSLQNVITLLIDDYKIYYDIEVKYGINCGYNYDINYDLIPYIIRWCNCKNEFDCKSVINDLHINKDVVVGEFVKVLLKINCIAFEFEKIAEYLNNIQLLQQLQLIPDLTIKYIASSQSLYV
jgi:superfamily II RNA helicase